jgi:exopolysaccharide biosynthesis polyprenyl glycosylphosphotransferase
MELRNLRDEKTYFAHEAHLEALADAELSGGVGSAAEPIALAEARGVPVAVTEGTVVNLLPGAVYENGDSGLGNRLVETLAGQSTIKPRAWLLSRALAFSDTVALVLSLLISDLIVGPAGQGEIDLRPQFLVFVVTLPLWLYVGKLYGLYSRDAERADHSTFDETLPVLHLVTLGSWFFFGLMLVFGFGDPRFGQVAIFWVAAMALILAGRVVTRSICRRNPAYRQNVVVVGTGEVGQLIARKFLQHPEYGINVVGFVDDEPCELHERLEQIAVVGNPEQLPDLADHYDLDRVIVAFSRDSHTRTLELVRTLRDHNVRIDIVPRLFEILGPSASLHGVGGVPLVGLPPLQLSGFSRLMKRCVDVVLASLALFLFAPALGAIALAIRLTSRGPIIFRQTRMGADEETFEIFKFRTMSADADLRKHEFAHLNKHARRGGDPRMFKIADDPRVTAVGRFLRKFSLDELPQLFNVLRGQMTLVGPRPLILEEDREITEWGRRRLELKPGITGPWQVLGRTDIPFEEMVKIDYLYITNWSLWRDLKLMVQTIPAIARERSVVY